MLDDPGRLKALLNRIFDEWEQNPNTHRVLKLPSTMLLRDAASSRRCLSPAFNGRVPSRLRGDLDRHRDDGSEPGRSPDG
jgi:hypothetical protein